ncbi:DUF2523 family protein [Variovorax sp. 350MFTsu5.1]|uniref:DUF2523 family protein n=1 Tax=Variovorax sp. 350MFTsu5.1 TaxID=3158365 RepID=UPI003AAED141
MKLGVWLLAMMEPLIAKVLATLGFSVITIVGMESVVAQLKAQIVAQMGALPVDVLNFALFMGIGKAIGIIFGACTTKLLLWSIQNATSILGKSNG